MSGKNQTKGIPRSSGVHQIRCKSNGKIYIGSAVNFPTRWKHHQKKLDQGSHKNRHLQQAWNKYGEENFEFTVLDKSGRQKSEPKVYTGFINPDGQRVIIANLRAFCREHELHPVHMHQLKNGQRKSHKGWTWKESNEQPDAS